MYSSSLYSSITYLYVCIQRVFCVCIYTILYSVLWLPTIGWWLLTKRGWIEKPPYRMDMDICFVVEVLHWRVKATLKCYKWCGSYWMDFAKFFFDVVNVDNSWTKWSSISLCLQKCWSIILPKLKGFCVRIEMNGSGRVENRQMTYKCV